jgi:hypothetical protein
MRKGDSRRREPRGSQAIIEWYAIRPFVWIIRGYLGRELYNQRQIPSPAVNGHTEFFMSISWALAICGRYNPQKVKLSGSESSNPWFWEASAPRFFRMNHGDLLRTFRNKFGCGFPLTHGSTNEDIVQIIILCSWSIHKTPIFYGIWATWISVFMNPHTSSRCPCAMNRFNWQFDVRKPREFPHKEKTEYLSIYIIFEQTSETLSLWGRLSLRCHKKTSVAPESLLLNLARLSIFSFLLPID